MDMNTSPAPALSRGLHILKLLQDEGALNLETIKNITNIPKASLLRFLTTLEESGCVVRNPDTKKFEARLQLAPVTSSLDSFSRSRDEVLESLSESLEVTAEWYEADENDLVLRQRVEPHSPTVNVIERVGYRLSLKDEKQAVVKAYKSSLSISKKVYDLSSQSSSLADDTIVFDLNDESQTSRISIAVLGYENEVVAILALAFAANADKSNPLFSKYAESNLKHAAKNLQREHRSALIGK